MNSGLLLAVSGLVLTGPWLLRPIPTHRPEIRGILRPLHRLNQFYCGLMHRLRFENQAPLPEHGPAILIANHTCAIDHMLLQSRSRRVLGFLIAREFYDFWALRPLCQLLGCIPVKRDGRDLAATRAALRALEQGRVVPIFPEGRILPTSGQEIGDGRLGVAFLALHAGVPVIPAYISGTPPTNGVWKSLSTPSRSRVVFGPPVELSDLATTPPFDRAALKAVTDRLMAAIVSLKSDPATRGGS